MLWWLAAIAFAGSADESIVPHGDGARGAAIRRVVAIDGVPVDGGETIRVDAAGRVLGVYGRALPTARKGGIALSGAEALAIASSVVPGEAPRARLSWQPIDDVLRRVWTVEMRPPTGVVRVRLDAVSGGVLSVEDGTASVEDVPLALAYVRNPTLDGEPVEVALPLAAAGLSDARVEVLQCRDQGEIQTFELDTGVWDLHVCTAVSATGPVDGDYLFEPVPYPVDGARDEDDFAAPHTYWNVHAGLDWFDALGWVPSSDFIDPRLIVTVNQRDTDLTTRASASDPTLLAAYENAYSTGGYLDFEDVWVPPELVFGQGSVVDYAYDADVIHHELAHYIVKSQGGPSRSSPNAYGPSLRSSSVNEAVADYFSSAIQGDPAVAEYAGDDAPIRELDGFATCAADLYGESHYDSLMLSQPLWLLRATLAGPDQTALDGAVLDSLSVMGTDLDFPDAALVLEDLVAERLGAGAGASLAAAFEARGLHDCAPVLDIEAGVDSFRRFSQVPAAYPFSVSGEVPGYLQFRVEVPAGGARLTLTFAQVEALEIDLFGTNVPQPLDVVGRTGDALGWERLEVVEQTTVSGNTIDVEVLDWVSDGATVATAAETGSYDAEGSRVHLYEAAWDVPAAGPFVFQLANASPRTATAYELALAMGPPGMYVADDWPIADPEGEESRAGCGCTTVEVRYAFAFPVVLFALGLRRARAGVRLRDPRADSSPRRE